jgi:heme A synthase
MYLLGRILGWLIVSSFFLTILNYPVKLVYRKRFAALPRESAARRGYQAFMRVITGGHRYFALLASTALIAHFIIQYANYGLLKISGVVAAILLILQGSLGAYGMYLKKRKPTFWLTAHRIIAILLIAAITVHALKV